MGNFAGIEQRFLNPQLGDVDTTLPDAATSLVSVVVFNISTANKVNVRCSGSQLIDASATKSIDPGTGVLFISDGVTWRSVVGAGAGAGVLSSRKIDTIAPLTGGGDLSADRTHAITSFAGLAPGAVPDATFAGPGTFLKADGTWAVPSAAVSITQVEKSLGSAPNARRSGSFTIADANILNGSKLTIVQAPGPYTGKGVRADEAEMDQVTVAGYGSSAGTGTCYWEANHRVRGNVKFNYVIG